MMRLHPSINWVSGYLEGSGYTLSLCDNHFWCPCYIIGMFKDTVEVSVGVFVFVSDFIVCLM